MAVSELEYAVRKAIVADSIAEPVKQEDHTQTQNQREDDNSGFVVFIHIHDSLEQQNESNTNHDDFESIGRIHVLLDVPIVELFRSSFIHRLRR